MREHPDRLAGPSLVLACGEFQSHLSSSPRICRREPRRGGYRDACSIARSLRGLLDACSIPRPRATPSPDGACDRPALPADHPPPVEHRGPPAAARRPVPEQDRRADSARQGRACQSEGTAKEPPLCHFTQLGDSCVGKVAAGGRATRPTNPGRTCEKRQALVASSRVQVRRTPVVPPRLVFQ
jgi:hypothetical protein